MSTAYQFLKESGVFFIATADGNKGRVRPFGFIMKKNNALYFCTNKSKDVYKQMARNPDVEISAMGPKGTSWLRVRGRIVFEDTREAKAQVFAEAPDLLRIYPKGADDEVFVTFYFTDAVATLFSFTEAPTVIDLL
jgi:uncharacterized pyridoxamine 5'-phosphate oxidase family protein